VGQDESLFDNTVEGLGRIGSEARAAIPALNRLLDEGTGYNLVKWALNRIGSPAVQEFFDGYSAAEIAMVGSGP
jgi:hypothetical protein